MAKEILYFKSEKKENSAYNALFKWKEIVFVILKSKLQKREIMGERNMLLMD